MTIAVGATAAALFVFALIWIASPLWKGAPAAASDDLRVIGLLVERESVLATLRDLDADALDARVAPDDHAALRDETVARGAAVLAALDHVLHQTADVASDGAAGVEEDVRLARARRTGGGA